MRIVLHDEDTGEPITVVSLQWVTDDFIRKHGKEFYVAACPAVACIPLVEDVLETKTISRVLIRAVEVWKGRNFWHWYFKTRESELALLLDAVLLPGQSKIAHEHYRRGHGRGMEFAIELMQVAARGGFRPG